MASKMNVAYVEKDIAEEHLRAIIIKEMLESSGKVNFMVHQLSSRYGGNRSAINHVCIFARLKMPEKNKIELSSFIVGTERAVICKDTYPCSQYPQRKQFISLEAYKLIVKTLFESGENRDILAHLFLVLDWCLMKRAEIVSSPKYTTFVFMITTSYLSLQSKRAIKR